jgi:hypothetical protein
MGSIHSVHFVTTVPSALALPSTDDEEVQVRVNSKRERYSLSAAVAMLPSWLLMWAFTRSSHIVELRI